MSAVSKSFTAVGDGPELLLRHGQAVTYDVSGTFVGTVVVQQFVKGGWQSLASKTAAASATLTIDGLGKIQARVRFQCSAFTSGTIVTTLTSGAVANVDQSFKDSTGADVMRVTPDGASFPAEKPMAATNAKMTTPTGSVYGVEATFAENGAGTYTAAVPVPAGATILDIIINGVALWAAGTSATLKVGDVADDDGYYTAVNLKATDLLAGESLAFDAAGGKAGAYIANAQVSPRYSSTARVVSGIVTSVGAGTTGRTRMTVLIHLPVTADIVAATQV